MLAKKITVNALLIKSIAFSLTSIMMFFATGNLYAGISITKGTGLPL